jgi:hypothetical protein
MNAMSASRSANPSRVSMSLRASAWDRFLLERPSSGPVSGARPVMTSAMASFCSRSSPLNPSPVNTV